MPANGAPAPLVGTQDDGASYGATFDALNIWELDVTGTRRRPQRRRWSSRPSSRRRRSTRSSLALHQPRLPPAAGITNPAQYLDILSIVSARFSTGLTGTSDLRNDGDQPVGRGNAWRRRRPLVRDSADRSTYSIYQQGTFAPGDGVHRWMGSIAMDKKGDIALGYSVVNGTTVYPGIRYTDGLPAIRSGV